MGKAVQTIGIFEEDNEIDVQEECFEGGTNCAFLIEELSEYHRQYSYHHHFLVVTNNKSLNVTFPRETYMHSAGSVLEIGSETRTLKRIRFFMVIIDSCHLFLA